MKRHKQLWGKRGKRAGAAFFQIWEKEVVRMRREVVRGRRDAEDLTTTVRAWIAHAKHAQSWGLRRAVLGH